MAFSFVNANPGTGFGGQSQPGGNQNAQLGPELQEIQTQEVGFLSIAGDSRIRLLPAPWGGDSLPAPTSSLLAVASTRGLLAAAGPDGVVVASTDSVRKAYSAEASGEGNIRPFQPQLQISLPSRVSHLTFSADENLLVVSAENGHGLAAYEVSALTQGNSQPCLTLPMNGASLRALAPNPATPELFAAVTTNGELLMANLKTRDLVRGPGGPVLKTGVSCISWSNKGKQVVAGLADGTAYQMTPDGQGQANIPRAPDIEGDQHISSISWLRDNIFFIVYTPTTFSDDRPLSSYYIVARQPQQSYTFRKLPEVCSPYGLDRFPAYQFTARLKDFGPHLKDVLVIASTASTDIGLFTRSTQPFADVVPRDDINDIFTTTTMSEDSRRAQLPMTEDYNDTSPIGLAVDLSSKETVPSPIRGEDIRSSATPLPSILVLNNEGILSSWWFVYAESIRQQQPYHGLAIAGGGQRPAQQQASPSPSAISPRTPKPFGQPAFGQTSFGDSTSSFGKLATPSFGPPSVLGSNLQPTFGTPTALGSSQSWQGRGFGNTSSSPPSAQTSGISFGSASTMGGTAPAPTFSNQRTPAFGQASTLGRQNVSPAFGQVATLSSRGFGVTDSATAPTGFTTSLLSGNVGFSSFATAGGFGSSVSSQPSLQSAFAKSSGDNPFAKAGQPVFESPQQSPSSIGFPSKQNGSASTFGLGTEGFVLHSGFTPDATAAMDEDKPEQTKGPFALGSAFGDMLDHKANEKTKNMDTKSTAENIPPTPIVTELGSRPLFGQQKDASVGAPSATKPAAPLQPVLPSITPESSKLSTSFVTLSPGAGLKDSVPSPSPSIPDGSSLSDSTVKVGQARDRESTPMPKFIEPPLPPDPVSRASYAPGDTSASSSSISKSSYDDAPLPPDFLPAKKAETPREVTVALPEESEGEAADFEDSGEDVTNEISPVDDATDPHLQSLKTSPESSFGGPSNRSPSELFTKISAPTQTQGPTRKLFGEISKPIFPPPSLPAARPRLSPRSPSPIRSLPGKNLLRPDGVRSTSAPSAPGRALAHRKATLETSMLANQIKPAADEEETSEENKLQVRRLVSEAQNLTDDDEEEQLRSDLARPLSPAPSLDPFLPHQEYTRESLKPGIPGQIERLYRDINAMIDTLGINSRSLSAFLLYQKIPKDHSHQGWLDMLQSEQPANILGNELHFSEIHGLRQGVNVLETGLQQGRVKNVQEKIEKCHKLLSRDLVALHGQCASIRRIIDAHTDSIAIITAPLSAEQATRQQELRESSTIVQSRLAELEEGISLLRAKLADSSEPNSDLNDPSRRKRPSMARPTVEAVTSTIATMTSMAEKKSGDLDVLEAQLRRMGIDLAESAPTATLEASPFLTPPPKRLGRPSRSSGSPCSRDGGTRSSYHTPEPVGSGSAFRSSAFGPGGKGLFRGSTGLWEHIPPEDTKRWNAKLSRRRVMVGHIKTTLEHRKAKVRGVDEV